MHNSPRGNGIINRERERRGFRRGLIKEDDADRDTRRAISREPGNTIERTTSKKNMNTTNTRKHAIQQFTYGTDIHTHQYVWGTVFFTM